MLDETILNHVVQYPAGVGFDVGLVDFPSLDWAQTVNHIVRHVEIHKT
jgi:hypothetical protein